MFFHIKQSSKIGGAPSHMRKAASLALRCSPRLERPMMNEMEAQEMLKFEQLVIMHVQESFRGKMQLIKDPTL